MVYIPGLLMAPEMVAVSDLISRSEMPTLGLRMYWESFFSMAEEAWSNVMPATLSCPASTMPMQPSVVTMVLLSERSGLL